ncbi:hypothetical protein [Halalkalibacter lacteus]|uniref:hypothetical protein n=1 Tax=Halalkalibacter lacteus TaxID=3090663 RepID=UPI002FCBD559
MKRWMLLAYIAFLLVGVVACGIEADESEETEPVNGNAEEVEQEEDLDPANSGTIDDAEIKEIPVEGETEMRKAQFHRSGLGYSIYGS